MFGIREDTQQALWRRSAAWAAENPEAGDATLGIYQINRRGNVVFIILAVGAVVIDAINPISLANRAIFINQERWTDFKLFHKRGVFSASAIDQKSNFTIHLAKDVRKGIPQGELAPGGWSVFAPAEVQHHHFATTVA